MAGTPSTLDHARTSGNVPTSTRPQDVARNTHTHTHTHKGTGTPQQLLQYSKTLEQSWQACPAWEPEMPMLHQRAYIRLLQHGSGRNKIPTSANCSYIIVQGNL